MRMRSVIAGALALVGVVAEVRAQCADLTPPPPPPALEAGCNPGTARRMLSGLLKGTGVAESCADKHAKAVEQWENRWRTFGGSFTQAVSHMANRSHSETLSVRGCRGEAIAIEVENQTISAFSYHLVAPSGRTVGQAQLQVSRGRGARSVYVQLPETGTYQLTLATESDSSQVLNNQRQYITMYRVSFPGGGLDPLTIGASETGTIDPSGVYARRVEVPPGRRVRLTASIQGAAASSLIIAEEDGNPLFNEPLSGRRIVQVLPTSDLERTFLVRIDAQSTAEGRGVELKLDELEETSVAFTLGQTIRDSFPGLPRDFNASRPRDAERMEEFLRTYQFTVEGTGQVYLKIEVAEAAGLQVRVSMFGRESQSSLVKDVVIGKATTIPLMLKTEEPFVIEIRPVAAQMGPNNRPIFNVRVDLDP
jgi:hypothetical protein